MSEALGAASWVCDPLVRRQSGVWEHVDGPIHVSFDEGDSVHAAVLAALRGARDVGSGSAELQEVAGRPGLAYHLSGTRANLLRGFELEHGDSVVEIGAGCGAITRYLGEQCRSVLAIEADGARAAAAAVRTRDLKGVTVVNAPIADLDLARKADVAVAIGVLEYAQVYEPGPEPALQALVRWQDLLTDDGVLILAIENKLGLKYLAGAPEDHSGLPYDGLEGYSRSGGRVAQTFGRAEIKSLLERAGFASIALHLPFPDYKFPRCVVAQNVTARAGADSLARLLADGLPRTGAPAATFSTELAWTEVLRNGLFEDLSNSFLVVAAKGRPRMSLSRPGWDAVLFNTTRLPAYWTQTELRDLGDRPVVERTRLSSGSPEGPVAQHAYVERWQDQPSVAHRISRRLQDHKTSLSDVAVELGPWMAYLDRHTAAGEIPGELLDALPTNGGIVDGVYTLFDREFAWRKPLPREIVVMRGLFYLLIAAVRRPGALRRYPAVPLVFLTLILRARLGGQRSGIVGLWRFFSFEAALQETLTGRPASDGRRSLIVALLLPVPVFVGSGRRRLLQLRLRRQTRAWRLGR